MPPTPINPTTTWSLGAWRASTGRKDDAATAAAVPRKTRRVTGTAVCDMALTLE
jgi:hypothetical protein